MPDNTRTLESGGKTAKEGEVVRKGLVEVELEARVFHHRKLRAFQERQYSSQSAIKHLWKGMLYIS